jgi:hypothetical protein
MVLPWRNASWTGNWWTGIAGKCVCCPRGFVEGQGIKVAGLRKLLNFKAGVYFM